MSLRTPARRKQDEARPACPRSQHGRGWNEQKEVPVSALIENPGVGAITMFSEDLERSKAFYQDVFGLAVLFEDGNSAVFKLGETIINLLRIPAAHELIEPGKVADREAGARYQLTVEVGNVDETCAELARRGVALLNGPMNRPWGIRTASFTDPGGHIWEIAQKLP
jgi:catechol 2,3-dioxygenase-like lactoylglutathione lyase family enzyme